MPTEELFYCLITDTSGGIDPRSLYSDTSLSVDGNNLYADADIGPWVTSIHGQCIDGKTKVRSEFLWSNLSGGHIYKPVFFQGEILIVNSDGREVSGRGRKPSKWIVGYETYKDANHAVQRSNILWHVEDRQPLPQKEHTVVDEQVMADLIEIQKEAMVHANQP